MQRSRRRPGAPAIALTFVALVAATPSHGADALVGLTDDGALHLFDASSPQTVRTVRIAGCAGTVIGIDRRPADDGLYGLTDGSEIVRIAPDGQCRTVASLTAPFTGGSQSGLDFNPQSDRLRVVSAEGQSVRIHPTLGATASDAAPKYAAGDPHAGSRAQLVGAAYPGNVANAPTTRLLVVDAGADVLALQDPPNDGVLTTIGALGIDVTPATGFEIVTSGETDRAWLATGGTLYRVDLATGRASAVGPIGNGSSIVALASLPTTVAP